MTPPPVLPPGPDPAEHPDVPDEQGRVWCSRCRRRVTPEERRRHRGESGSGIDFVKAAKRSIKVDGLDLSRAGLERAKLSSVDLSAAVGLTVEQLEVAYGDKSTRLPVQVPFPTPGPTIPSLASGSSGRSQAVPWTCASPNYA